MARDGVSAEVLYPTRALEHFSQTDARLQEACFRVYNEWLEQYCAAAPERLFASPACRFSASRRRSRKRNARRRPAPAAC